MERPLKPGGFNRSKRRMKEYRQAQKRADEEIKMFKIGESSEENIIYLADRAEKQDLKKEA